MTENFAEEWERPIRDLNQRLRRSSLEQIPLLASAGRVLAQPIMADRDSPAADVSAMDGYALTVADLSRTEPIPVAGQSAPGQPPPQPTKDHALRVFTGGMVPKGYELVVKRENTIESDGAIVLNEVARLGRFGENIRRQGENALSGQQVLDPGTLLTGAAIAVAANFGAAEVEVTRRIRVAILTTGDELKSVDQPVAPWQLRDSNGPTLYGLLQRHRWLDVDQPHRVADQLDTLQDAIRAVLDRVDVLLLTGGVSMGDFDFVPQAIQRAGGEIAFHRLPIRPGRPILGAVGPAGQLILGLPGNPVSAAVGATRFGVPLLAAMADYSSLPLPREVVLTNPDEKSLNLHWFRLVQLLPANRAELVTSQGSGDLVSLASSSGFIHQPLGEAGLGPWSYFSWD